MSVVDLVGVLDDGTAQDLSQVPANPRAVLRLVQGSTLTVRLRVLGANGVPVDLSDSGTSLVLAAKRYGGQYVPDILITGSKNPGAGPECATFTLAPNATKFLSPGRYSYAVWLTRTAGRSAVIPPSSFIIEPGVLLP